MPDTDTNQTLLETHCLWKKGQYQEWGGWQRGVREEAWGQQVVPSWRGQTPLSLSGSFLYTVGLAH